MWEEVFAFFKVIFLLFSDGKPPNSGQSHHDIEAWTYCVSSTVITFVRCYFSEPYFAVHFYVFDASTLVPDLDTDDDEVNIFIFS